MNPFRRFTVSTALALAVLAASGCGGDEPPNAGGPASGSSNGKIEGTIEIDGSSTVYRISKAAQEAFEEINPEVTVVVNNHGTGGGFGRYLEGEVDIVDASRPAKPEEETRAKAQGIDWTRFVVGYDGITVVVNAHNSAVTAMSVEQLKKLWQTGSSVTTWKDLDPTWPDRSIIFYSPDNDSGTYEFFTEAVVGKAKSQREGVQQNSDDNTLVNGVANDQDGIGYFGYAYYAANKERLKAVAIQNGPGAKPVAPSPETIADKSYAPLSRPLFLYVKNSAARRPEVKQFIGFYLDRVAELARTAGYDPPSQAERDANKAALQALEAGKKPASVEPAATGAAPSVKP